jgi:hypothetical protein
MKGHEGKGVPGPVVRSRDSPAMNGHVGEGEAGAEATKLMAAADGEELLYQTPRFLPEPKESDPPRRLGVRRVVGAIRFRADSTQRKKQVNILG